MGNRSIAHFGDLKHVQVRPHQKPTTCSTGWVPTFQDSGRKTTFDYLKNFGFKNEVEVVMLGTNAKMNEMQRETVVQVLGHLYGIITKRRWISELYRERLKDIPGINMSPPLPSTFVGNGDAPIEIVEQELNLEPRPLVR